MNAKVKKIMRTFVIALAVVGGFGAILADGPCGARLAETGRTDYAIVVSADASACDRFAAEELRRFLGESTGADVPIVAEGESRNRKTIELGTARARQIVGEAQVALLREEECRYKITADGTVAIVGCGRVGIAYGVYAFLEREIGCRWFSKVGDSLVPKHASLTLAPREHSEKPAYEYRTVLCCDSGKADTSSDLFYFRNRLNMRDFTHCPDRKLAATLPVRLKELHPSCHSFFIYVPPDGPNGYFKDHPEYFTQSSNGKRVTDRQLCFSNRGLRKTLTENFIRHAKKQGGSGFLDLSQRDMAGPLCWCAECQALEKKFDSPGGPFFDYLLEEAPKIKAACPEIIIHFLAYHRDTTQRPPRSSVPFPDNVAVVFAPLDDDFSKPIDHPNNVESLQNLRDWCKLCRVWLWNYPGSYAEGPLPYVCLARTAADMRLDYEAGARGAYVEHDACRATGANFFDLQLWMLMQSYRNPYADWKALRKEFCDFYYAPVADEILAYADYLETNLAETSEYIDFQGRCDAYLTPSELVRWQRRFDEIEAKVQGLPDILQRVREARLSLDVSTLVHRRAISREVPSYRVSAQTLRDRAVATWRAAVERRYDRTDKLGKAWRKKYLDDARAFKMLDTRLFLATTDIKPLPAEFKALPEDKIIQAFPLTASKYIAREKMEDASTGYAQHEIAVDEVGKRFPFGIGIYDYGRGKTVIARKIQKGEVEKGRFKLYKLGRCALPSASCSTWMGRSWRMSESLGAAYRPGMGPDDLFDVYISLKFEGDDCSRVYYDRTVIVGPNVPGCP